MFRNEKEYTAINETYGYTYKVVYSKRRTVQFSIHSDNDSLILLVKAPYRMRKEAISKELELHKKWILKHLSEAQTHKKQAEERGVLSENDIKEIKKKARDYIPGRVECYSQLMGVKYGKIYIRLQKTRWGSCSSKGNLNFNCLLMLTPKEVIDSVVVHELAHRLHMNHSKDFYTDVLRFYPEYKQWNAWLKKNGKTILLCAGK